MRLVNISLIVNEILIALEQNNIISHNDLTNTKLILNMCLSQYQITEEETSVSTEVDPTNAYFERFILDMKLRGCTEKSIEGYGREIKKLLLFVNKSVIDIQYADIQRYLAYGKIQRKWADRTYNSKLIMIRSFFSFLYEEDLISNNPGKKLKETKVEYKIGATVNAYQREEIKCACEDEREVAFCEILYSTGIRISELCALNIQDINFHERTAIVYGKGRKEREIYFSEQAKLHLERYLKTRKDSNPALFVSKVKPYRRMTIAGLRYMLKQVQLRDPNIANIKLSPHVYRRSVATDMINKGAPIELVASKLGHANLDTTKKCYASISRNTIRQAHEKYVG